MMDFVPLMNIMPFGVCSSLSYPATVAATAAAFGVLTPMPCVPVVVSPWVPSSPNTMVGTGVGLGIGDKAMCMWGGMINITIPGQFTVL